MRLVLSVCVCVCDACTLLHLASFNLGERNMLLTVLKCIVTGRNEVVAKVIFLHLSVILFTGGSASVHAGIPPPPARRPPSKETPPKKEAPPQKEAPPRRRHPPAKETPWEGDPLQRRPLGRRPPCKGEPPSPPAKETPPKKEPPPPTGPHPRGKLRGIRCRSTPKGKIEGDQIQAHTQGGN